MVVEKTKGKPIYGSKKRVTLHQDNWTIHTWTHYWWASCTDIKGP